MSTQEPTLPDATPGGSSPANAQPFESITAKPTEPVSVPSLEFMPTRPVSVPLVGSSPILPSPVPATNSARTGALERFTAPVLAIGAAILIGIALLVAPSLPIALIIAGIICVLAAIAGCIMLVRTNEKQSWGIAAGVLVAIALICFVGDNGIGHAYVQLEEGRGAYNAAITDLKALGEKPPYSSTLAQCYLDWAASDVQSHAYNSAVDHYTYTAQKFPTLPQAATANQKLPDTYLAWAKYTLAHNDSISAGQAYFALYTKYSKSIAADQARSDAPSVLLASGDGLAKGNYYQQANDTYQLLISTFPQAPEAAKAHMGAATNLLAWAKALQDAKRYNDAGTRYTDLAKNFGDTPEGKQAQDVLSKGVNVTGRLFKADGKTPVYLHTNVRLSTNWTSQDGTNYTASGQQYYADTDENGYFVFVNIPAGQYLLEWRNTIGAYQTLADGKNLDEIITVAPLQPVTIASITTEQK
jgi:tetratricopeptide (TPR) repeat protein